MRAKKRAVRVTCADTLGFTLFTVMLESAVFPSNVARTVISPGSSSAVTSHVELSMQSEKRATVIP